MLIGTTTMKNEGVKLSTGEVLSFKAFANAERAIKVLQGRSAQDLNGVVFSWPNGVDWWDIGPIVALLRDRGYRKAENALREFICSGSFTVSVITRRPADELPKELEDRPEDLWRDNPAAWRFDAGMSKGKRQVRILVEYDNSAYNWEEGYAGKAGPYATDVSWEEFINFSK